MSLFSVTSAGLITVDSSSIASSFENAYKEALGANLNTEAGTFQGQMIQTDTAMLTYAQNQCALIANAFSVYSATGTALDVVAGFWGYYRKEGVATAVNCTLTGTADIVIPAGSLVSDGTYQYVLLENATIGAGGSVTAQFQCTTSGAIVCQAGTITEIVSTLLGWDTVTNPTAGMTGYEKESDNAFKARITANWFNIRGRGALGAIVDNMAQLPNVISVLGRENPSNASITIDDITLPEHSVYVCIAGGANEDIAKTMYNQKTIGADTVGDTEVVWYDETTGLTNRYHIQRPTQVSLAIQVTYASNYFTPTNITQQIQTAILAYIEANPLAIGQMVSGNWLAQAFNEFDSAAIVSVKVGIAGDSPTYEDYQAMTISQIPSISAENITTVEIS